MIGNNIPDTEKDEKADRIDILMLYLEQMRNQVSDYFHFEAETESFCERDHYFIILQDKFADKFLI